MRGGKRKGAGRKSKSDEVKLIERLDNVIDQDKALQSLSRLIDEGNMQAVKLYFQYRYGLPRDHVNTEDTEPKRFVIEYTHKEDTDVIEIG